MSKKPAPSSDKKTEKVNPAYEKPKVTSESLTAVAALCNGTAGGGRKATTPTCTASKLKS